ncbi:MAG: two-component system LytT family sensor kinase [Flavobacteriales bacterium]|jgi:two-component system LytT family sensor kinase
MMDETIKPFNKPSWTSTQQFYIFNALGFLGYGMFFSLAGFIWQSTEAFFFHYLPANTLVGFLLTIPMRYCYRAIWLWPIALQSIVAFVVTAIITGLWAFTGMVLHFELVHHDFPISIDSFYSWYKYSIFIVVSWTALYFGVKNYQLLQEEKQRSLKIQAIATQAQLKMLRYQLNPHFLFNTLNAISTLILEQDTKLANRMVVELSKFLRYSLENDPMEKVIMIEEINALKLYLNIEKVRFEERLCLDFDIDESAEKALIPSLILQPLVENSIKYAVSKSETGGTIRIAAKAFAGELLIELSDDGPGITSLNGDIPDFDGVGIRNFRERLSELYNDTHGCKFSNVDPHGLLISIRIPLELHQG